MNGNYTRGSGPRSRLLRASAVLLGLCAWDVCALAQAPTEPNAGGLKVTVLRSTAPDTAAFADSIDATLVRDLSGIAGIDQPQLSPIEYEEVQLAVGCVGQTRECLSAIAGMSQVSGLIVRSLSQAGTALQLDLVYFDTSSQDEPARASATGDADQLVDQVPVLVRRLFGIPEVPVPAVAAASAEESDGAATAAAPARASDRGTGGINGLTLASIVTLAVGAGVGVAGIVVGASSAASFDDYKRTNVTDRESATEASAAYDDASSQATVANVLIPIGGALLIGGAILLVVGLSSDDDDAATQVSVAPSRHGGTLMIAGAL